MATKNHRDFVVFVRNGVEINALVAISHLVTIPATQTEPAQTIEHLTLSYLDPNLASQRPSGDQLRNSQLVAFDVPRLSEGKNFGWKDVVDYNVQPASAEAQGSGSERYTDGDGFAGPGDPYGIRNYTDQSPLSPGNIGPDGKTDAERGFPWGGPDHMRSIGGAKPAGEFDAEFVQNDPEAFNAFHDRRTGTESTADKPYTQVLKENADNSSGHSGEQTFPSGDGRVLSGHGPNPPVDPGADPSLVDNPAPSSAKDEAIPQGDVVGE